MNNGIQAGKLFFEEGIPGFPHLQFYQLTQYEPGSPFFSLDSLEEAQVGFWLVDPFAFFPDYQFTLSDSAKASLRIDETSTPVGVLNIITIRGNDQVTVNLKAPIVLNLAKRMGKQVILGDDRYSVRQPLVAIKQQAGG
ncbi:flagellar assembly protein FliW [Brevibacillus marinus]|uniref:flagellar assembly protein FliW n=1 Tax=Brevibacillus marinus TaxID=2496837 RepID=UPI000F823E30|nr:flagellar assembly protein FliW [Brevibacillus marinus]